MADMMNAGITSEDIRHKRDGLTAKFARQTKGLGEQGLDDGGPPEERG